MNEATAIRWIEQMPITSEEKERAVNDIKGKDPNEIKSKIAGLKSKAGSSFYMNKKTKPFWTK